MLIDEIGRGTSTYDGVALAKATAEHLIDVNRSLTLFATHFFELTDIGAKNGVANVHLEVTDNNGDVVFLHRVSNGPANQSYGLSVAALAGIPESVVQKARKYLAHLHEDASLEPRTTSGRAPTRTETADISQGNLFEDRSLAELDALRKALGGINPDDLTPKLALELVYQLKDLINH